MVEKIKRLVGERFTKFVGSSLISTAVDQVMAYLLFGWLRPVFVGMDFMRIFAATLIARVCSVAVNYTINMKRVFTTDTAEHERIREEHEEDLAREGTGGVMTVEIDDDDQAGIDMDDIVEGPSDDVRLGKVEVRPMRESLPRFIALAALVLTLSSIGVYIGHTILGFNESACKLVVDSMLFFLNYYGQRTWVFARTPRKTHRVRLRHRPGRRGGDREEA